MISYAETKTVATSLAAVISPVAAFFFLTLAAHTAFAQGGSRSMSPTPVERRTEISNRQATDYEIEKSSRDLKTPAENSADPRHILAVGEQIKHDFDKLQESHNQLVLSMADKDGVSRQHDSIFRAIAEIKKSAVRLKTNLALPKTEQEKDRLMTIDDQLGNSLLSLRKYIYDFVTNPLFESRGVLDLKQGQKAGRDLESIIELSESLIKSEAKLEKPD